MSAMTLGQAALSFAVVTFLHVDVAIAGIGWLIVGWTVGLLAWALQIVWAWLYFTGRWAS